MKAMDDECVALTGKIKEIKESETKSIKNY
jgi:hypothetical protein